MNQPVVVHDDHIPAICVREQLSRVLVSAEFTTSPRLKQLLSFIVEQTLNGRASELKEYSLGVEVFARTSNFDPRIDPIVRVEAGRLRHRLARYYDICGPNEAVRIEVPKGGYVPSFSWMSRNALWRGRTAELSSDSRRLADSPQRLGVCPIEDHSHVSDWGCLARSITGELIHVLSRSRAIRVFACSRNASGTVAGQNGTHELDLVLEGSVRVCGKVARVVARLVDSRHGRYTWSEAFDFELEDTFSLERGVAERIVRGIEDHVQPHEVTVTPMPTDKSACSSKLSERSLLLGSVG